jgi:hypothetical protein
MKDGCVAVLLDPEERVLVNGAVSLDENPARPARIACGTYAWLGESSDHECCVRVRVAGNLQLTFPQFSKIANRTRECLTNHEPSQITRAAMTTIAR